MMPTDTTNIKELAFSRDKYGNFHNTEKLNTEKKNIKQPSNVFVKKKSITVQL